MIRRSFRAVAIAAMALAILLPSVATFAAESDAQKYLETHKTSPSLLLLFLREMPKGGDLHSHLSGAIYAESMIDWAVEKKLCLDLATYTLSPQPCRPSEVMADTAYSNPNLYRGMIDAYSMRNWQLSGQSGHDHFFDTFNKFGAATHGSDGPMLAETAERAASQREIYQELMLTLTGPPFNHMLAADAVKSIPLTEDASTETLAALRKALLENGMTGAVQDAIQQANQAEKIRDAKLGCDTPKPQAGCTVMQRYLFQVLRGLPKQVVYAQMVLGFELAKADPRFVGLNMVMPEDYYIPMHDFPLHMRMMHYLHRQYPSIHVSLHAGELAYGVVPPEGLRFHIRDSVEVAGAERIGHGVDVLFETEALQLMSEMAKKPVMVEICLTSNDLILGVQGNQHPLHQYMKAGVPVALATDDEGVSRSDMSREYLRGVQDQDLSYADLKRMARNSLQYAFIPGTSLWSDAKTLEPVKQCSELKTGAAITKTCRDYANEKTNQKAALQLKLEQQFRAFESQSWIVEAVAPERQPSNP